MGRSSSPVNHLARARGTRSLPTPPPQNATPFHTALHTIPAFHGAPALLTEPLVTLSESSTIAAVRLTIPRAAIQAEMGAAINEVLAALTAQSLRPAGPLISHHLTLSSTTFDFEVGFPIDGQLAPTGRVFQSSIPESKVLRAIYQGPYEGLFTAWSEFDRKVKALGRKVRPDIWERYLLGPESGPDASKYITELNVPLA